LILGLRALRSLMNFESDLRELCRKNIERGKVSLTLSENRGNDIFTVPASTTPLRNVLPTI